MSSQTYGSPILQRVAVAVVVVDDAPVVAVAAVVANAVAAAVVSIGVMVTQH